MEILHYKDNERYIILLQISIDEVYTHCASRWVRIRIRVMIMEDQWIMVFLIPTATASSEIFPSFLQNFNTCCCKMPTSSGPTPNFSPSCLTFTFSLSICDRTHSCLFSK